MGQLQRIWYNPETKKYLVLGLNGALRTNLVCDIETKRVYYMFDIGVHGYMSPYIGLNGKSCRLIDEQIVEDD